MELNMIHNYALVSNDTVVRIIFNCQFRDKKIEGVRLG